MAWDDTTDLGCGATLCSSLGWFVVCRYWPQGKHSMIFFIFPSGREQKEEKITNFFFFFFFKVIMLM